MRRSSSVLLQSPNRRRSIGVLGTQNNVERHSIVVCCCRLCGCVERRAEWCQLRLEHGLNVRRSDSFESKCLLSHWMSKISGKRGDGKPSGRLHPTICPRRHLSFLGCHGQERPQVNQDQTFRAANVVGNLTVLSDKSKARKPSALPYTHPFSKLLRALVAEGSVSGSSKDSAAASMVDLHLP